jgi:SAM-dependent methyltransferase
MNELGTKDVRITVRERYGAIAEGRSAGCCGTDCGCTGGSVEGVLEQIGYTADQIGAIPEESNLGLGCGSPLALAGAAPGETVLDLGSGGGLDVFLAAQAVGPTGRALGVDMTPAMIERARATAAKHGAANVEFRLGEIEHLPIADSSVDLLISNCVINLSPDKPQVFREAHRVLKPGGRMVVSDLVLVRSLTPEMQRSVDLYVGCVAGASLREEYLALAREAGFQQVEVLKETGYDPGLSSLPDDSPERAAFESVRSITVRAVRR